MKRILVVEDDESLRETVQDWLGFEKFMVETAADGQEAVEQLQVNDFDLIVLDWQLPHLNGIEVLRRYRGAGGTTPVLFLSGMSSAQEKQACLEAGATEFLPKPFQLQDLSKAIKKIIG